jgi:hypothetical protein
MGMMVEATAMNSDEERERERERESETEIPGPDNEVICDLGFE